MHVLFDHGTPAPLVPFLEDHTVTTAKDRGWDTLSNGDLIQAAEAGGFDVLITTDKNIRHQQNWKGRRLALIVLGTPRWPVVRKHVEKVVQAVNMATSGSYIEVDLPLD